MLNLQSDSLHFVQHFHAEMPFSVRVRWISIGYLHLSVDLYCLQMSVLLNCAEDERSLEKKSNLLSSCYFFYSMKSLDYLTNTCRNERCIQMIWGNQVSEEPFYLQYCTSYEYKCVRKYCFLPNVLENNTDDLRINNDGRFPLWYISGESQLLFFSSSLGVCLLIRWSFWKKVNEFVK